MADPAIERTMRTPVGATEAIPPLRAMVSFTIALALILPVAGCGGTSVVVRETPRDRPAQSRKPPPPKPGASTVVRKGETLYRIATRHGISPLDLAMWNRIAPPYTIYPGQRLRLTPPAPRRDPPPAARPSTPPVAGTRPATRPPAPAPTRPQPPATRPTAPAGNQTPPPPAASVAAAFAWRWPADGNLISRFAAGDPTRQGIGIAGTAGSPVRAAADGVVVYSGSGLVGYGELIIVKHDEQWLSAYGHNRARLVNEGQRVRAGEQIAEMGRSGAARDMLHFEIRFNGRPQDPLGYLPKR
jgi:lipoprotein NlpD